MCALFDGEISPLLIPTLYSSAQHCRKLCEHALPLQDTRLPVTYRTYDWTLKRGYDTLEDGALLGAGVLLQLLLGRSQYVLRYRVALDCS